MDKRAAVVLGIIFGGLFLVLFGFLVLAWSALKATTVSGLDSELSTSTGPRVGVVECKGTVGDGERGIDADKVVKLLRKYERDDDVKAVVVRVESPGGAVAPSQEIYSALRNLRNKKKVVVLSADQARTRNPNRTRNRPPKMTPSSTAARLSTSTPCRTEGVLTSRAPS